MNNLLTSVYRTVRHFRWRDICRGIGAGLVTLGCLNLVMDIVLLPHVQQIRFIPIVLLTTGLTLIIAGARKKVTASSYPEKHKEYTFIGIIIAVLLSIILIPGDIRSWMLVGLTVAVAIVVSYRI